MHGPICIPIHKVGETWCTIARRARRLAYFLAHSLTHPLTHSLTCSMIAQSSSKVAPSLRFLTRNETISPLGSSTCTCNQQRVTHSSWQPHRHGTSCVPHRAHPPSDPRVPSTLHSRLLIASLLSPPHSRLLTLSTSLLSPPQHSRLLTLSTSLPHPRLFTLASSRSPPHSRLTPHARTCTPSL